MPDYSLTNATNGATFGQTWSDVITTSFQSLWSGFINVVPTIIFALIILILGWMVAYALEQVVARLLKVVKLNEGLDKTGALNSFKRAGVNFNASVFVAAFVRWFIFFVFLIAVADVLNLTAFNAFLQRVLLYVPNIVLAVLILLVAAIGGDLLDRFISGSIRAAGFSYGSFVGSVARWSAVIFGLIAALQQLGIASALLQTIVTGIIAMLALAGGLAFGLGGKDMASDILHNLRKKIR